MAQVRKVRDVGSVVAKLFAAGVLLAVLTGCIAPEQYVYNAIWSNNIDQIDNFLEKDKINSFNENGRTFLVYAVQYEKLESAAHLIRIGADVNKGVSSTYTNYKDSSEMVEFSTPLYYAVTRGNLEMVKLLVKNGAAVNQPSTFINKTKNTKTTMYPLEVAVKKADTSVIEYLLANGARTNVEPTFENDGVKTVTTPLHQATSNGKYKVISILAAAGADPLAKDSDGKTSMQLAREKNDDIVVALFEKYVKKTEVQGAISLTITSPKIENGRKITERYSSIFIRGAAKSNCDIAEVKVNDKPVFVDRDGNFSVEILLIPGENQVNVSATDDNKRTVSKSFVIMRQP